MNIFLLKGGNFVLAISLQRLIGNGADLVKMLNWSNAIILSYLQAFRMGRFELKDLEI